MKIGPVVPEHGRSFRPSLHRRRLQSPENGSCGELQVKVAASKTALKLTNKCTMASNLQYYLELQRDYTYFIPGVF